MNKKLCTFAFLFFYCVRAHACDVAGIEQDAPPLCGHATQGGMLYGKVKGWDIYKAEGKEQRAKISDNGVFVLGLDRDEPEFLKLTFCRDDKSAVCKTYTYKIIQRKYPEQKVTVPEKFVKYSEDVQKSIDRENAEIVSARRAAAFDKSLEFTDFKSPLPLSKYQISGVFGSRRVFNGQPKSPHKGLDIAAPTGTSVNSAAPGRVIIATEMFLTGRTVFVSHGFGITSAYFHLDSIDVKKGDSVTASTVLGKVGATGRVSGAHLHFGIYHLQTALDPEILIRARTLDRV